jgi:hypothetical protein
MNDDRVRAVWECELDRLELDVLRTERLLKGLTTAPIEPWDPPSVPGQMPPDLAERAQDLLDRQERATIDLATALAAAQKQIAYGVRVADATAPSPSRPVYLDLEA